MAGCEGFLVTELPPSSFKATSDATMSTGGYRPGSMDEGDEECPSWVSLLASKARRR